LGIKGNIDINYMEQDAIHYFSEGIGRNKLED